MSSIIQIFQDLKPDDAALREFVSIQSPETKYVIAITPRSGSSFLGDMLTRSNSFGRVGEVLAKEFIPNIRMNVPGSNPDEYLVNVLKKLQTRNSVAGIKASWYQFREFCNALSGPEVFREFKYIYLIRRDMAAQAVSLYRATETKVFHTNIEHSEEALEKLLGLGYDFKLIEKWYQHIKAQESGWSSYFQEVGIFPLCITYEEIEEDVRSVVRRISTYLGVQNVDIESPEKSIHKKLSGRQNIEWACKFVLDLDESVRPKMNL